MKPKEERREIVLKVLRGEVTQAEAAREHGITRQTVYDYLSWVVDDPEGRLRQAEEDLEFRREVVRLVS